MYSESHAVTNCNDFPIHTRLHASRVASLVNVRGKSLVLLSVVMQ